MIRSLEIQDDNFNHIDELRLSPGQNIIILGSSHGQDSIGASVKDLSCHHRSLGSNPELPAAKDKITKIQSCGFESSQCQSY